MKREEYIVSAKNRRRTHREAEKTHQGSRDEMNGKNRW